MERVPVAFFKIATIYIISKVVVIRRAYDIMLCKGDFYIWPPLLVRCRFNWHILNAIGASFLFYTEPSKLVVCTRTKPFKEVCIIIATFFLIRFTFARSPKPVSGMYAFKHLLSSSTNKDASVLSGLYSRGNLVRSTEEDKTLKCSCNQAASVKEVETLR